MKVKAVNGFAQILKAEGIPWVSCYPTSPVNNALGEEGVPILMMGEERFAVAVADAYKACEDVKAKGGKVTRPAGPMKHGGSVIAFVEDPDGYKIEFIERR